MTTTIYTFSDRSLESLCYEEMKFSLIRRPSRIPDTEWYDNTILVLKKIWAITEAIAHFIVRNDARLVKYQ